jgi:hypothetical protein
MFGRDWEKAEATAVAVKEITSWTGDPDSDVTQSIPHEYVVDVRPEGQPPFRATFRDAFVRGHMDHPSEGQVINVLCRPKSGDAKLIADEWKKSSGKSDAKRAEEDRFDAAKQGSPGDAAPGASAADQLTELGARYERGELTDAEYEAAMAKVWDR